MPQKDTPVTPPQVTADMSDSGSNSHFYVSGSLQSSGSTANVPLADSVAVHSGQYLACTRAQGLKKMYAHWQ